VDSLRKTALWAGVLYLISFVSIPTLILYGPVKESGYIAGAGPDTGVLFGSLLELIVGLAGIGTAVVLYKVLKRQNQAAALGLVGSRVLEGMLNATARAIPVRRELQESLGRRACRTDHGSGFEPRARY
jgi:hypothetical protein